jgi:O-antigen/teichoic acid export membrane protein
MLMNVCISFLTKGGTAVISILLVPIFLKLLTKGEFGVWNTLSTIINWFYFLDIGLSNGFKNLFTRAVVEENFSLAKKYVSTIYAILLAISILFILSFELILPYLNWHSILNFDIQTVPTFNWVIQVVFLSFAFKLALTVLNTTLVANQQFSKGMILEFISQIIIICFAYWMLQNDVKSFLFIAVISSITSVAITFFATIYFFGFGNLRPYSPSIQLVDFSLVKELFGKGAQFFVIQVAVLVTFTGNNLFIAQFFGQESVAEFSVLSKYFSIPIMGFILVIGPFWSGFAEAYFKKDFHWVKVSIKRLLLVWMGLFFGLLLMVVFFKDISKLWVGDLELINPSLVWLYGLFVLINAFNSIFSYFLNGVGAIRLQLVWTLITGVCSLPISFVLCSIDGLGMSGVIISNLICLLPGAIIGPIQYLKIINQKATGVWIK